MSSRLRSVANIFRATPLHPQWLLGRKGKELSLIRRLSAGRVLDIGCADRWVEGVLPEECEYLGVDYTVTGKHIYGARPDVFADASELPFNSASMDAVVMLEVVEHLRSPGKALAECARVLKPRGCFIASMPFLYPMHDEPHDYQRYTTHGWAREVESLGMRLDSIEPRLEALETAALMVCLALAGVGAESVRLKSWSILLLPAIMVAIPCVNMLAWASTRLLPSWGAMASGYVIKATKL